MENRHGLVTDVMLTQATGTAEWEAALDMLERLPVVHRVTGGGDKNYDTLLMAAPDGGMKYLPHDVAIKKLRATTLGATKVRAEGY